MYVLNPVMKVGDQLTGKYLDGCIRGMKAVRSAESKEKCTVCVDAVKACPKTRETYAPFVPMNFRWV